MSRRNAIKNAITFVLGMFAIDNSYAENSRNNLCNNENGQFLSLNTIKELLQKIPDKEGEKVFVSGFNRVNDSGGGIFVSQRDNNSITDYGFIFRINESWIWKRQTDLSFITPEMFGAIGDGKTNDTESLQRCIDYIYSSFRGGAIVFSNKTYVCNLMLKPGVSLVGIGGGSSYGYLPNKLVRKPTIQAYKGGAIITGASNSSIINIDLNGLGTNTPLVGIYIPKKADRVFIKNCNINGISDEGIITEGIACVIEDVLALNCLMNRQRQHRTGVIKMLGTDSFMNRVEANCSIKELTSEELLLAAIYIGGANHFITNCVGELSEIGVYIDASGGWHRLTNVRADLNFGYGFYGGFAQFTGCTAFNNSNGSDGIYSGFYCTAPGLYVGCLSQTMYKHSRHSYSFEAAKLTSQSKNEQLIFKGCTGFGSKNGLFFQHNNDSSISFELSNTSINGTGANPSLNGNQVYIATDLLPTMITNFSHGVQGQDLYIKGKGNVTIQHNSFIKNKLMGNLTLGEDRIYHYKLLDGIWYEI